MVKLSNLRPRKGAIKKGRRIGRGPGSGKGTTAGKGYNGQLARAGGGVPIGFEGGQMPLTRSLPKRGFTNIFKTEYQIVNLKDLDRKAAGQNVLNPEQMRALGLIASAKKPVKVLGIGSVTIPLTIQAHAFSASAKEKILQANGKAELIKKSRSPKSK